MRIGIVGIGRMGTALAKTLRNSFDLVLYDSSYELAATRAKELTVSAVNRLTELAGLEAIILAIQDNKVLNCINDFRRLNISANIISIATNISQKSLQMVSGQGIYCISAKMIAQADEMAAGERPVVVISPGPDKLIQLAETIFSSIGDVMIDDSEMVRIINSIAVEKAVEAAVMIEDQLYAAGFRNPIIIRAALRQVAAGVVKAYSSENLGPYASAIAERVREENILHKEPGCRPRSGQSSALRQLQS